MQGVRPFIVPEVNVAVDLGPGKFAAIVMRALAWQTNDDDDHCAGLRGKPQRACSPWPRAAQRQTNDDDDPTRPAPPPMPPRKLLLLPTGMLSQSNRSTDHIVPAASVAQTNDDDAQNVSIWPFQS